MRHLNNINVAFGHDCVMDPWYSLGKHDMLEVAHMGLHVGQMTGIQEMNQMFQAITTNGAKVMQLDNYGLEVGCDANLVVHQAKNPIDAIRLSNARLFVIRNDAESFNTLTSETFVFQKSFLNKVLIRIKIARKFKFYMRMVISGSKNVKKGQKILKRATIWTYSWFFQKNFALANLIHINSYNKRRKKCDVIIYF